MADIGADSTAIAWVIAKNQEQANSFQQQKKNYRKGVIDGNGNDGKLEEDYTADIPPNGTIIIGSDENGSTTADSPFIADLTHGLKFNCGENTVNGVTDNYTAVLSVDMSITRAGWEEYSFGQLKGEVYNSSNEAVVRVAIGNSSNWAIKSYVKGGQWDKYLVSYVTEWRLNPNSYYMSQQIISVIKFINRYSWGEEWYEYYTRPWYSDHTTYDVWNIPFEGIGNFGTFFDVLRNAKNISTNF